METDDRLRGWLRRAQATQGLITRCVQLYRHPESAGGLSNEGVSFAERAANGCPTILHDTLNVVIEHAGALRDDVQRAMESAPRTTHNPGSPQKIDVLCERFARGQSLFVPGDGECDLN